MPLPSHSRSVVEEPATRSVTRRVLSVLDVFAGERGWLTLSDISRRTGMPLTTTHRLVGELVSWGALERSHNGRYQIGLHLWAVAALAPRGLELREVAIPFLEDLSETTGRQQVRLAVLDGMDAVLVERIRARGAGSAREPTGGRSPAHATGDGLVLLAFAAVAVQERYLAGHQPGAGLRRALAEVRRTGFAMSDQIVSVGAPVRDATGEVIAAVSIVVGPHGPRPSTLGPAVVVTGRTISRALSRRAEGG
ncbi:IclR family transcriptional regulator [Actinomadura vinacea]|uniref:IclR family transcriptional regulator n=1 Tax=Actinomadura vinacea TaxID=115336 RepID=A0ABN3ICQ0_9ACTN